MLVDDALYRAFDFRVAELGLGLALELWLANLDRQNSGQSLTNVVAAQGEVGLLQRTALRRVVVDRTRQRRLEAGEVRSTLVGVYVVYERKDVPVVAIFLLER